MMRFAYRPYPVDPSPADPSPVSYRPDLMVRVRGAAGPTDGIPLWGVLDTAAVDCILPYDAADRIKPIWCDEARSITDFAGGVREVQYGRVHFQAQIEGKRARWPAIVAFSRDRRIALWGRCGFLDHFSVTFNGPARFFITRLRDPMPTGFTVESLPRRRRSGSRGSDLITPADQEP
jgi:hypothetical protein